MNRLTQLVFWRIFAAGLAWIITGTGCNEGNARLSSSPLPIEPGKVYEKVFCRDHPTISYAIYLPSMFNLTDSLPVVLAFDPGGLGDIPVKAYQDLAERYRFILIGSLDSRNGLGSDRSEEIVFALMREIRKYIPGQRSRLYCLGFSGGSRVSSAVAFYRGGIRGVIGCGAGFPAADTPPRHKADYFGLVGDRDFNYLEIAIRWHESRAAVLGLSRPDTAPERLIREQSRADSLSLAGIDPSSLNREEQLQLLYLEAMPKQPVAWWKNQLVRLNNGEHSGDSLMNSRLLSYGSMLAYTFANQAVKEADRNKLERMIAIYELIDPQNQYIGSLKVKLETLP